jgi:hypothetical protein
MPSIPSLPGTVRPDTGVPSTMSAEPVSLDNRTVCAAASTANNVTSCSRASPRNESALAVPRSNSTTSPSRARIGGRSVSTGKSAAAGGVAKT